MIETGKPFKMKPKTRKAEKALWQAADLLGIHQEEVWWEQLQYIEGRYTGTRQILVKAEGDDDFDTARWVQTQDDPDWEIVK